MMLTEKQIREVQEWAEENEEAWERIGFGIRAVVEAMTHVVGAYGLERFVRLMKYGDAGYVIAMQRRRRGSYGHH